MKYMILIQSNPQFLERWKALPEDMRERFGHDHVALSAELAESGELVASEGLADPALAKRVAVDDNQTVISDGPFA
ncbi:YciI family protein, partial [Mycobacterium sp. 1165178.9]|uniref:YciI family protein n=1 Tax=Mycobacterium sp. 1165178.9 TaxID=1834070 RepID=UPI001E5CBCB6